ncbi:hypothetical protein QTH90_23570 [Variovorax sp. J2P1-59]|uniref:hypothetical protein n=1 Tax=Variovorax flavidus TaxID=3053501 RepID=UPI0025781F76|nr:hypothetical protein [Variovorax sp. J2P1-59]MDM0077406.1 hypothetical protein [Variovorax sp. J2P1-59]
MSRLAAKRRAGVLAYTLRAREYMRRTLRSQHYAPLVFTRLDDLIAMGPGAKTLDMLLLGDAPELDSQGQPLLAGIRSVIGPDVPVLRLQLQNDAKHIHRRATAEGDFPLSPRFFSDLYRVILSFLDAHGFESSPSHLAWGDYSFDPLRRAVAFEKREARLDAVAFDIALELFFNTDRTLTRKALRQMLPSGEQGQTGYRIDNIGSVIKDIRSALQLRGSRGWALETFPHAGYRLMRMAPAPPLAPPLPSVSQYQQPTDLLQLN